MRNKCSLNTAIGLLLAGTALAVAASSAAALDRPAAQSAGLTLQKPQPAQAQPAFPVNIAGAPAPDAVELAALYYYAKEGQTGRVEAETRRLAGKYPAFAVPNDLYRSDTAPQVDEAPLWDLYKASDFAGIEALTEKLVAQHPGWQPSADFTGKLQRARLRNALAADYERNDWPAILDRAGAIDSRSETEIDLLWIVAEACRETGALDRMATIYRDILYRDPAGAFAPELRLATLQKAARDFAPADIRATLAQLQLPADQEPAAAALRRDLTRREVADFNADKARKDPLAAAVVDPLRRDAEIPDMILLGWYNLKIGRAPEAETWFRRAADREPEADSIKGLYLSLRAQNHDKEARELIAARLDILAADGNFLLDALSPIFSTPGEAVAAATVKAYSDAILKAQSPEHAEMLGWYAYNSRQFEAAAAWFGKSFDWQRRGTALKGLVLSNAQLKRKDRIEALRRELAQAFPDAFSETRVAPVVGASRDDVATPSAAVSPRYADLLKAKRYGDCLAEVAAIGAKRQPGPEIAVVKGWCALGLGRGAEAAEAFATAVGVKGAIGSDAAYGMTLALLRSGQFDDAEAVIARYPLSAERNREVRSQIFAARANSAFKAEQYQAVIAALDARLQLAPEDAGLSRLRGWSHYHLGHRAEARAIFTRLNLVMDDRANRQALAVINEEWAR